LYKKVLPRGFVLQSTEPRHVPALARLQEIIFPSLSNEERLQEKHYYKHLEIFPAGQFVVLKDEIPIGMSTTMRHHFTEEDHTFLEISGQMMMGTHEPTGDWLYGLDLGIHPDYRGLGLARAMYEARQALCKTLGLKGQITVGMPLGYAQFAHQMDIQTYFKKILEKQVFDPTVGIQQKLGFKVIRLIQNYLHDPACGHAGVLMIWPLGNADHFQP
jgi:GNAT superfamily N-acetyltransferase